MDPKDFAMGEAERLDYAYRLPLYSTMELFIETLTGTCFELRVSPYETVISVKAKIQRLEGIPISQQFLIWQNVELEDDYCLHDYNITDGCTLKLVLAMRGGPINTRRIAMEDPGLNEVADYVESNREELLEKLSPPPTSGNGNKQVTLLVYHDGDQLNFFRVVDRGDGTLTPFSESLSGSACNLREEDDEEVTNGGQIRRSPGQQPLSVAQMVENNITAAKMKQLRSQMQALQLQTTAIATNKKQLPSIIQATPIVKMDDKSSRPKSHKHKDIPIAHDANHSPRNLPANSKPQNQFLSNVSSATHGESSDVSNSPNGSAGDATSCHSATSALMPVSRADFRRAQLKRMKSVKDSHDEPPDISVKEKLSSEENSPNTDAEKLVNKLESKEIDVGKPRPKPEAPKDKNDQEANGRFSPRTRRLLNALENNTKRPVNTTQSTNAYRSSRPSVMQGMTFNRHDMYLRSYGLIASPDEVAEEHDASSSSEKSSSQTKPDEPSNSKVHETSHGVKYSSSGGSTGQVVGAGLRFLKSPPGWPPEDMAAAQPSPSRSNWLKMPKPYQAHMLGDSPRCNERHFRPPSSSCQNIPSHAVHQKSFYDTMMAKGSKDIRSTTDNDQDSTPTRQWRKLDSLYLPQPPAPDVTLATPSWQKQRLRRLSLSKPTVEKGHIVPSQRADANATEDPLLSARRQFRQTSSKSGLRVKESPHSKVESISRQEAREVVDFINKAVDASILRTLVRSPLKDGPSGNNVQTSHRLHGSGYRNAEGVKSMLQAPHGSGLRSSTRQPIGPPTLPPVKRQTKKKRCFLCAKRTGLASSYVCRCGNNFCATHRYAETHNCTYDYKTSGRKLLEEANPLVSAPKLPKI